jgi:tricorn protease
VLFASSRASWAPSGAARFWTVPATGGIEEPMALHAASRQDLATGTHIAYRMNSSWDDERRNYRGGQNRPIWIVDLKSYDLVSPPWTDSKDTDPVVGRRQRVLPFGSRWRRQRVGVRHARERLRQVTKFTDFDVKAIDAGGGGAVVSSRAGTITSWIRVAARDDADDHRDGRLPVDDAALGDVSSRVSNIAISPTGRRAVVEARGEIFTIPTDKGDIRNLTTVERIGGEESGVVAGREVHLVLQRQGGEYRLVIAPQDGITAPREITLPKPTQYYTPSWSPDSTKILYSDTNLNVWVLDVASGQTKVVGRESVDGAERTLNPVWSPDSKWVAYAGRLQSLFHAIFVSNVETGETKQVTDSLAMRCGRRGTRAGSTCGSWRRRTSASDRSGST